jgi:hypothetical protein
MASSRPAPYPLATLPQAAPPIPDRRFLFLSGEYMFEVVLRPHSLRWAHGRFVHCEHHFYAVAGVQHLYMRFHWDDDWARAKVNLYTLIYDGHARIWRGRGHAEHQFLVELPAN